MGIQANGKVKRKAPRDAESRLRTECRHLRAELAKVRAERDTYLKSLYALTRKPVSFTAEELRDMTKNRGKLDDVIKELQASKE